MEQHVDHTTAGPSQPGSGKPPRHDRVRPRSAWAVWSMLAVSVVSLVFAPILAVANGIFQQDAATQLLLYLTFGAFMVVGALIVTHRPGNAIGWLFSAIALLAFTAQLAGQYAIYPSLTRAGGLPRAVLCGLYGTWPWWLVTVLTLVFTPLLFPTGRLPSPRWRPVAWLAGAATAALTALASFRTHLEVAPGQVVANPIGVGAVGNPEGSPVVPVLNILLTVCVVL